MAAYDFDMIVIGGGGRGLNGFGDSGELRGKNHDG